MSAPYPLLAAKGLSKTYRGARGLWPGASRGSVEALSEVSLELRPGETLGIVGGSGSGKTTFLRLLARLVEPTHGELRFEGRDVLGLSNHDLRKSFRPRVRMIFQDPDASLNPGYTVGEGLEKAIIMHNAGRQRPREVAADLLRSVGMDESFLEKYPDELSGGEKRRMGICRALSSDPRLILADEPLSGLDVLLQEMVLVLMRREQNKRGFAMVLISHDLDRVTQACDRIMVMHRGRVVEEVLVQAGAGRSTAVYRHPYSLLLHNARDRLGNAPIPTAIQAPRVDRAGCSVVGECSLHQALGSPGLCVTKTPVLTTLPGGGSVACHFPDHQL